MNLRSQQEKMMTEMVTVKSSVQEMEINVNNINIKVNKQDREMEGMLKKYERGWVKAGDSPRLHGQSERGE